MTYKKISISNHIQYNEIACKLVITYNQKDPITLMSWSLNYFSFSFSHLNTFNRRRTWHAFDIAKTSIWHVEYDFSIILSLCFGSWYGRNINPCLLCSVYSLQITSLSLNFFHKVWIWRAVCDKPWNSQGKGLQESNKTQTLILWQEGKPNPSVW